MTYKDLYTKYRKVLRAYPGIGNLCGIPGEIGKATTINYVKSGSRWREISRETENITADYYLNSVTAMPFFRALGGYERVEMGYCVMGCLPLKLTSISPDRQQRTVREFTLL